MFKNPDKVLWTHFFAPWLWSPIHIVSSSVSLTRPRLKCSKRKWSLNVLTRWKHLHTVFMRWTKGLECLSRPKCMLLCNILKNVLCLLDVHLMPILAMLWDLWKERGCENMRRFEIRCVNQSINLDPDYVVLRKFWRKRQRAQPPPVP